MSKTEKQTRSLVAYYVSQDRYDCSFVKTMYDLKQERGIDAPEILKCDVICTDLSDPKYTGVDESTHLDNPISRFVYAQIIQNHIDDIDHMWKEDCNLNEEFDKLSRYFVETGLPLPMDIKRDDPRFPSLVKTMYRMWIIRETLVMMKRLGATQNVNP